MIFSFIILLIFSVLAEGVVTTLPLTLVCLICFTIFRRDTSVFPLAFLAGLFIDIFRVQPLGVTSLFYICYLFLILLYKKKYEIYSIPFVMLSTFSGTFVYLLLFQSGASFMLALVSAGIAVVIFAVINFATNIAKNKNTSKFLPV
jgi:hypothetical protein